MVTSVKNQLQSLGAVITHEYTTVLKGFAVTAPEEAMESFEIQAQDFEYPITVEQDKVVCKYRNKRSALGA